MKSIENINHELPLLEHIRELRKRIILSSLSIIFTSLISFILYDKYIQLLIIPFNNMNTQLDNSLYIQTIFEGFLIKIKISFLAGLILGFPIIIYHLVRFIFPGLKPIEKKVITISIIFSFVLIIFSVYMSYFKIIPLSIRFLTGHQFVPQNIHFLLNYGKNINHIFKFMLYSLLIFQIPLIIEILLFFNIISRQVLVKSFRYIIIAIFLISAIITPPDFISQLGIALPLIILMLLIILIAKIFHFGEKKDV
jgi:sec-independent protein translocase protein TatC